MNHLPRYFTALALCACALFGTAAGAQNLLVNPGFADSLNGWDLQTGFGITTQWSPLDHANGASSGSLQGTLPSQTTFRNPSYANQCITLAPNRDYEFGAKVLLPSATTPGSSRAYVAIEILSAPNCSGGATNVAYSPQVMTTGAWTETSAQFSTGPAEVSAFVLLFVSAPPQTLLQSHFDDVYVQFPELIFASGFED